MPLKCDPLLGSISVTSIPSRLVGPGCRWTGLLEKGAGRCGNNDETDVVFVLFCCFLVFSTQGLEEMPKGVKRGSFENDKDGTVAKHYLLQGGRTSLWLLLSVLLRQVGMPPALGKKCQDYIAEGWLLPRAIQ